MTEHTLTTTDRGLRVISEPLPGVRSVALGIWVGVGSRFEREHEAGISHFIEHLIFKGTPDYSAQRIAELFDGLGGEVNAATGRDYTVFYTRILDEHIDEAVPVLTDMLQRPGFFDLDEAREVVLEEIAMYDDDAQDQVHELVGAAVFPEQPLGRPAIVIDGLRRRCIQHGVAVEQRHLDEHRPRLLRPALAHGAEYSLGLAAAQIGGHPDA